MFLLSEILLQRWKKRFGVQHLEHNWNFMAWGFHIICSRSLRHMAKHTADLCFGCTNVPVLKPEEGFFFFPILILETTLESVSNRHLQWPLYVLRDRLTAGCGLRWPYCKTPKPTAYFPKGRLKTHSLWAHFCGMPLWWRIRQGAFAWQLIPMHIPNTTFPIEHYFPLFLLYITFAFTMLFIWARSFLYMQSLHKSCKG